MTFSLRSCLRLLLGTLALGTAVGCGGGPQYGAPETKGATTGVTPPNENGPGDDMPITEAPTPPKASGNPFNGVKLWVDPESLAMLRSKALMQSDPENAKLIHDRIAVYPQALWLGEWNRNVYRKVRYVVDMAAQESSLPIFVAYNVPGRDCGDQSAGGLKTGDMYKRWIRQIAAGIGDRAAVMILEPDALGLLDKPDARDPNKPCLTPEQQEERLNLLHDAVKVLRQNPKTIVYIDGAHSKWAPVDVISDRLKRAGVLDSNGFAINTSNYRANEELLPYGKAVSAKLGGVHFVVDTSRNGNGPLGVEWCNPPGRKLGMPPSMNTGDPLIDAYLWLKRPGESDGACNGAPKAGEFWDKAAIELCK
ncbi:MAG: glycoside hydrolase family 6 protein [Polyangiaceae bacterium]